MRNIIHNAVTVAAITIILAGASLSAIAADPETWVEPVTGMEFVNIAAGCFQMGCSASDGECYSDEKPQHEVCVDEFWIGKYEVTQIQWEKITGSNPSMPKNEDAPVTMVSWESAQEFLQALNQQAGQDAFRLPTEAEWEYAARAGSDSAYSFGGNAAQLAEYGWYSENSGYQMHAAGELKPNAWGLYDMHGNAWEWCQDWYGKAYYADSPKENPQGPAEGDEKVSRGCAAPIGADDCRSSSRNPLEPESKNPATGLRLVVTAPLP